MVSKRLEVTFQFTLPRGERPGRDAFACAFPLFQFTLPRGERPAIGRQIGTDKRFNSRSRVGSDWQGIRRGGVADYSLFCAEYSID